MLYGQIKSDQMRLNTARSHHISLHRWSTSVSRGRTAYQHTSLSDSQTQITIVIRLTQSSDSQTTWPTTYPIRLWQSDIPYEKNRLSFVDVESTVTSDRSG